MESFAVTTRISVRQVVPDFSIIQQHGRWERRTVAQGELRKDLTIGWADIDVSTIGFFGGNGVSMVTGIRTQIGTVTATAHVMFRPTPV